MSRMTSLMCQGGSINFSETCKFLLLDKGSLYCKLSCSYWRAWHRTCAKVEVSISRKPAGSHLRICMLLIKTFLAALMLWHQGQQMQGYKSWGLAPNQVPRERPSITSTHFFWKNLVTGTKICFLWLQYKLVMAKSPGFFPSICRCSVMLNAGQVAATIQYLGNWTNQRPNWTVPATRPLKFVSCDSSSN